MQNSRLRVTLVAIVLMITALACVIIADDTHIVVVTATQAAPTPTPTRGITISQTPGPKAETQIPTPTTAITTPLPPPPNTAVPQPAAGSWQHIPALPRHINAWVVDPNAPQVIYAGTGQGGSGSGIYRSEDAGLNWESVSTELPHQAVTALAFDHGNPATLYAVVGSSVFSSQEGGRTWILLAEQVGQGRGFEQLIVAPDNKTLYGYARVAGVFRSKDGGATWMAINEGLPKDEDATNVQVITLDSQYPDIVYVGTGWGPFNGNGVYKSVDGGSTWAPANQGMLDYSIGALAIVPRAAQILYAGSHNGDLFKSVDNGENWVSLNDGLPNIASARTAILDIQLTPLNPDMIFLLNIYEGILLSEDGGMTWQMIGKPTSLDHHTYTAMAVVFSPQPVLFVGIRDQGAWRREME